MATKRKHGDKAGVGVNLRKFVPAHFPCEDQVEISAQCDHLVWIHGRLLVLDELVDLEDVRYHAPRQLKLTSRLLAS